MKEIKLKNQSKLVKSLFSGIGIIFGLLTILFFSPTIKINAYNQEYYTTDDCGNNMLYSYVRGGLDFTGCEQGFYYYTPDCYRIEYTITWENRDGSVISTGNCFYGGQPNYLGTIPMRNDIEDCEFKGWSPNYSVIKGPQTYTATYFCGRTVTYKSGSDTLGTQEVNYGEKVGNISILSEGQRVISAYLDEEKTIPFDIDNAVITGNIDIYVELGCVDHYHEEGGACILETYNIDWLNWDGSMIKTDIVGYNNYPNYLGETPTKPDDECYTYPFRDWFPQIGKAIQDISYTAQYYQYNRYFDVIYMDGENEIGDDSASCGTYRLMDYAEKLGYIFEGWYLDSDLTEKLGDSLEINGDITIYGKRNSCPDGYTAVNNRCISSNAGVFYEDGYIRLTDGEDTVYIKDRNQGAQFSILNDNVDEDLTYGIYYYWGNNNGAMRDELGVDTSNPGSMRANVSLLATDRGFDGGHLGEPEGKGWIEGNIQANPCDPEEGEYLPTVDDWKKAMGIWYETKGYNLNINDYDDYGYIYYDSEFMNDILVPNAGFIKYDHQVWAYSKQDNTSKMNLLVLLFANPVMAEYQGSWDFISYIQNGYPYLWSAVNSGHKFGIFEGGDQYYYKDIDINEYDFDINAIAAPVRCFIDPDEVNGVEKYTVTFDTKGGNETVPAQIVKEGKKLKEPATPTRDRYTFDGWYTSDGKEWNFDENKVQGDMTLYAKWETCPEGQSVANNKCVTLGVTYQDNVTTYIDALGNEFEMGSITVSNGEDVITLLDRNLGATATGGEEAYGYHFQWGNNFGFDPNKSIKTRTSKVDASDYYRYNPYFSDSFYTNSNSSASARDSSNNNDLWGGINQGEPSIGYRMQGPCPAGYHVPSADEWATLLEIYHDLDDRGSSLDGYYPAYEVENRAFRKGFQDTFYIAYAGFRDNNASLTNQGSVARLWTSTPYDDGEGKQSWRFYLDKNRVDLSGTRMQRLNGYSVRCFLDTDEESVSNTIVLSFDTRGGTKISSKTLQRGNSFDMKIVPTKKDDKFVGRYMDKNLIQSYNGQSFERDTTLYAKYMSDLIVHENYATTYTDTQGRVFNMGTFTIDVDGHSITLLDRNLGATSTNGEDAYGYYFQWGNNYGFSWYNAIQTSDTLVDASDYAWDNPYVDDNFIVGNSNWDNSSNSDLWGDNTDTQAARQGPCPAGYHVPTLDEWGDLIDAYAYYSEDSYGSTAFREGFQDTFKIPLAGRMRYRDGSSVSAGEVENEGSHARIWASDDNGDLAGRFYLGGNTVDTNNNSEKAYGYQVRCFKNSDVDTVTLFYEVNGGTPMQAQTLPKGDEGYLPGYETTKKGDELKGWYSDISITQEFDFNTPLMQDTTIYAKWGLSHVVTFMDRDGSVLKTQIINDGGNAIAPQAPFRGGYVFNGWDLDFSNVTGDMVITAQYTKNQSTSNGGGGGGNSLRRDNCPDGDYSDSYYDGECGKRPSQKDDERNSSTKPQNNKTGHNSADEVVYNTYKFNPKYSDEMNQAYQFAYYYGITTKSPIINADMNGKLTRIAMAKMLSQYAINVLGMKPDTTRNNKFVDVSNKMDKEYNDGVTLAYQLGIMGINMPNNEFKPYNYVTRAEFATAFSRLLYNTSDGKYEMTSNYYVPHINKLSYEGILANTDPYMKELRGYVMLMLMRSAK